MIVWIRLLFNESAWFARGFKRVNQDHTLYNNIEAWMNLELGFDILNAMQRNELT